VSSVNLFSILFDRSLAFGRQKKDDLTVPATLLATADEVIE
jgi:hypothetical protein